MRPLRRFAPLLLLLAACAPGTARAHDPSAWGGIYRTRDGGETWFLANEGRFVTAVLALAVSPVDSSHLLLATDSGLLRSRNGGRDWEVDGQGMLLGAIYAVAFDADGTRALAATGTGLVASDGDGAPWRPVDAPAGASPARLLVPGAVAGRVYLAGWTGLFRSDDWGASWTALANPDEDGVGSPVGPVTAIAVVPEPTETVLAIAAGQLWAGPDAAASWQPRGAGLSGPVDAVAADPRLADRLWAAGDDRLFRSDDRGRSWQPVGNALPEQQTTIRAIGVSNDAKRVVLTTDRGLFSSADGGVTWELLVDNVPAHLEARPLVRDPRDPATFYAGFSIAPYDGLWQSAVDGRTALARLDPIDLAGGLAFLILVGLAAGWTLRRLTPYYQPTPHAHGSGPEPEAISQ